MCLRQDFFLVKCLFCFAVFVQFSSFGMLIGPTILYFIIFGPVPFQFSLSLIHAVRNGFTVCNLGCFMTNQSFLHYLHTGMSY